MALPSSGGTITGGGGYSYGETCTLTATPATGYKFTKWTKNNIQVSTSATYTFTVTEDASYVAVFTKKTYTITATANPTAGGTVTGADDYLYGSTCTLTATANEGCHFDHWTEDDMVVSTDPVYSFTVLDNAELVAHFSLNSYEITANANPSEGGVITGAGTYNHGAGVTLTATANEGDTSAAIASVFNAAFNLTLGDKVVSQTEGFAIFNGTTWEGTLTMLNPGQGYVYVSQAQATKTVTF